MLDSASSAVLIGEDLAECLPIRQARIFVPTDRCHGDQGAEQRPFAPARSPQDIGIDQAVTDAHAPRLAHITASHHADYADHLPANRRGCGPD